MPKLAPVAPNGPRVTVDKESKEISADHDVKVKSCSCCKKENVEMFRCKRCHAGAFCSKKCQVKCWPDHKVWCDHIVLLESQIKDKLFAEVNYVSSSSDFVPKDEMKLVKLVGRKCTVNCLLDGVSEKVLWDTGGQVSLLSKCWLDEHFPEKQVRDVAELLEDDEKLYLAAANNTKIAYLGYTEIVLEMANGKPLKVPFLVTEEEMSMPLIGNNVIEESASGEKENEMRNRSDVVDMFESSLEKIDRKKAEALVNPIEQLVTADVPEILGDVKIGVKDVVIPKGRNFRLKCFSNCGPVNEDTPVLFQPDLLLDLDSGLVVGEGVMLLERGRTSRSSIPVSNPTGSDVVLKARSHVGVLAPVASVIPCPVQVNEIKPSIQKDDPEQESKDETEDCDDESEECEEESGPDEDVELSDEPDWLDLIDLGHLTLFLCIN